MVLRKIFLVAVVFSMTTPLMTVNGEDLSPVISDLKVTPEKGPAGTTFTITLRITDPQGADDIIGTLFQMREGRESIEVSINDDGLNGDVSKGDGIYTGKDQVPKTAAKETHLFEVFVRDKSGHRSNVLRYDFTVLEGVVI
ncbi:MAG: choice-of-anchor X domain-containing protein [Nitrospiria bacterium]